MKRITRDDTEHGVEYYRANEVDSLLTDQPAQQEPFCWCIESVDSADWCFAATKKGVIVNSLLMDEQCVKSEPFALYAAPPAQRTWVGLTDKDINDLVKEFDGLPITLSYAIEAKLKEKNT